MKAATADQKRKKLPDFSQMTDDEIAKFWDTHSFVDYWDEMEEIDVEVKRSPTEVVGLRLEKQDLEQIKKVARKLGMGYSTLLRVWIKEKLRERQATGAKAAKT